MQSGPSASNAVSAPSGAGGASAGAGSAGRGGSGGSGAQPEHRAGESPKETVISIVIAFAMAFVFRGFVVEAFVIPTGSMAPTLLGQHMRFHEPSTGNDWAVGPWQSSPRSPTDYLAVQENVLVHDPMSGAEQASRRVSLRSGDRILVLKYLYAVSPPKRFDVAVFKDPHDTHLQSPGRLADNYIKRLIGLPGEQIALVDGDVFVRKPRADDPPYDPRTAWTLEGWRVARKPAVVQRAVWQPVFDTSMAPVPAAGGFQRPWRSADAGWRFDAERVYEWRPGGGSGGTTTRLVFDQERVRHPGGRGRDAAYWALTDSYPYNESPLSSKDPFQQRQFSVPDVRVRAGIEPVESGAVTVAAVVEVHRHEFRLEIEGSVARLRVRKPTGEAGVMVWETLGEADVAPLTAGRVTNVELWHVDQSLRAYVDGRLVIGPVGMDWSIAERFRFSTGRRLEEVLAKQANGSRHNVLDDPSLYRYSRPLVRWELAGGSGGGGAVGVRMHGVAVDRDLYYRPDSDSPFLHDVPGLATSPFAPVRLNADQFFCCGDNSPQSLDGRLWGAPDPWVAREFGGDWGVVPRELLLGRAFFVYWPSLLKDRGPVPVPDFGRMRFIW